MFFIHICSLHHITLYIFLFFLSTLLCSTFFSVYIIYPTPSLSLYCCLSVTLSHYSTSRVICCPFSFTFCFHIYFPIILLLYSIAVNFHCLFCSQLHIGYILFMFYLSIYIKIPCFICEYILIFNLTIYSYNIGVYDFIIIISHIFILLLYMIL